MDVVRDAFRPAPADVEWAAAVLASATSMDTDGSGVATLADGSFIDTPVIRQAETIAALNRRSS